MKSKYKILLVLSSLSFYPFFSSCSSIPSNIVFEKSDDSVVFSNSTGTGNTLPGAVYYGGPVAKTANPSASINPAYYPTHPAKQTPKATPTPTSTLIPTPSPTPTKESTSSTSNGNSSSSGNSGSSGSSSGGGSGSSTSLTYIILDPAKPMSEGSGGVNVTLDTTKPVNTVD